ncbi:MAG: trigger factor, partial [Erysipelotrichaceae bacterium]|nr:trigger factor [Erysipelotrichaceae bacterium]
YGMSLTGYLQMMGQTADQLKDSYRGNAEKTVKMRLALARIAELENIEPTEEEIEAEYQNIASMYQMSIDDVKKYIDKDMLMNDLKNQNAYKFVKENAKH